MSKNLLVISVDIRETRVALIEDGIIAELHIERANQAISEGHTGDIYVGKVVRVIPGLQAAFVDIGLERSAFLHVEDLIRSDDFETYLSGGRKLAHEKDPSELLHTEEDGGFEADEGPSKPLSLEMEDSCDVLSDAQEDHGVPLPVAETSSEEEMPHLVQENSLPGAVGDSFLSLPEEDLPGFTIEETPNVSLPQATRGHRWEGGQSASKLRRAQERKQKTHETGRTAHTSGRLSKTTPISEVIKEGQEILVQITKESIGTKGARCSSHISLPGRYVVYLPTLDQVGVSKRIGSEKERSRLREAIEAMKPPTGGLVVRTVAEGLTKKQLKQDVGYLVRLWGEIAKKKEEVKKSPVCLYSELDLVLKVSRDLFTDGIDRIVIDDRIQYERVRRFIEMFMPERLQDVVLYEGEDSLFEAYGIEEEINRALARKVPLPSGGHLVLDQAEALTAIDVNTGRFIGKGTKDMEETLFQTNLEAIREIAYQLRFRNIGGLIILDLIDMEKPANREKIQKTLEELLRKDKAKISLNRISELGLIEMTRKRTRESLGRLMHEPCFYCDGTGQLRSKETIGYQILREIRRRKGELSGYTIVVNLHPTVADFLTRTERLAVQEVENRYMRKIVFSPRKEYHVEQFDLQGR